AVEQREQEDHERVGLALAGEQPQPDLGDRAPVLVAVDVGAVERSALMHRADEPADVRDRFRRRYLDLAVHALSVSAARSTGLSSARCLWTFISPRSTSVARAARSTGRCSRRSWPFSTL